MSTAARKSSAPASPTWMIKASDLTEIKFVASCTNTTTRTDVRPANQIELIEISSQGMVLKLPVRSCAFGHMLIVLLERRRSKPFVEAAESEEKKSRNSKKTSLWVVEDKIQFTAKVTELEPMGSKSVAVSVQFYQCDQDHWQKFLEEISTRQQSVTRLVQRMSD